MIDVLIKETSISKIVQFHLFCPQQMHSYEPLANVHSFFTLLLLFEIIQAADVSFYFSVEENLAMIVGSQLNSTIYTQDAMLCATACAKEMNCHTANYIEAEKKCELFGEQMEDVLNNQAATVFLKGCYLIKKVRIFALYPCCHCTLKSRLMYAHLRQNFSSVYGLICNCSESFTVLERSIYNTLRTTSPYSYFEKGCRKKCTQQYQKVLWVVLIVLLFKEI